MTQVTGPSGLSCPCPQLQAAGARGVKAYSNSEALWGDHPAG